MANYELMISPRTFRLATTHPWIITVQANQPTKIPRPMVPDAMKAGMTLMRPENTEEIVEPKHDNPEPTNATARQKLLLATIEAIADRNDAKEFNAAGVPSAKAVSMRVRFQVSQREITSMWDARRTRLVEEEAQQAFERRMAEDVPVFAAATTESDK